MAHDEAGGRRPSPHEELVVLSAPTQVWSGRDGSMGTSTVHGVFHGEWRYVRDLALLVDGEPVEHVATRDTDGVTVFHGLARPTDDPAAGDGVCVERMREVTPGGLIERVALANGRDVPITVVIELACEIGFARIGDVRTGAASLVDVRREAGEAVVTDGTRTLRARGRGGDVSVADDRVVVSSHRVVRPGDWCTLELELELDDPTLAVRGVLVSTPRPTLEPTGRAATDRWTERAVADIEDLLLDAGHGAFPAAGAPWHLTMSAREALIASRLLLPLGPRIAEGTLRTLTARQGVRYDPATGEEPGRILHEMRQHRLEAQQPVERAPRFTRTLDETPLWIVLLHDAWRAGLPLQTVRELRLGLHAALWWLRQHSSSGFVEERELQSVEHDEADEPIGEPEASPPRVVDAAVQALACRAAVGAAALLDALGDDGDPWRAWAERLRRRFREAFWVTRDGTRFPAPTLDAEGAPQPALGAALGALLGSTLLDRDEERIVARLLLDPRLSSGFGLRSLAADAPDHRPMAEHHGAVRPVDTAVAIEGLLRIGLRTEARALAEQLERAADAFDGRMPEAYAGCAAEETGTPLALPGACSPQACSAAAVVPARLALAARDVPDERPDERPEERPGEQPIAPLIAPPPPRPDSPPSQEPAPIIARGGSRAARAHLRLVEPLVNER